ncbi:hypothetical protein Clacol_007826 [Clathrus columnatus]|uniref:Carbohydrate esterase family 16 protein n=1 Tax=Clathrus columnatus TaxID=1419009 RepID=A0AAV5AKV1_9AGAM|nr:hypothetical protein Clacol_007826 [Clathrus columnatus]
MQKIIILAIFINIVGALRLDNQRNDGIHLAVGPQCGRLSGPVADVNAGLLPLQRYKTIVAFGDSYTDGGTRDGGSRAPAIVIPPNPKAGGRTTNGPVWVEDIGSDTGALVKDYAVGGAVTDAKLWPSKANASDFITQADGIGNLPKAANTIIEQVTLLTRPPTNARSFLVLDDYGRGTESVAGDAFKQQYYTGLYNLSRTIPGFKAAFVDFKTIWNGVLGPDPGYKAFGYASDGACTLNSSTTIGSCDDPEHTFYWIPG